MVVAEVEQQNKILLDHITKLEQKITNLVERPTVNNNTQNVVMQNLQPLTDEEIQEHLRHLTLNVIQDGAKGFAIFANSYPFKDRLVCTDKSRKKIKYKNPDGEIVNDPHGKKITQRFFQAIATRNQEIITTEYALLQKEVEEIATNNRAHETDLVGLLTKATHLQDLLIKCQEAARGEENEFTQEFVYHLTKLL